MEKKRNQTFVYLYALAIIMVIDDHCGTRINLLSNIFPYNSFYMPLFVFASGYFFHQSSLIETIKRKTKKLLVPYILWGIVAVILSMGLDYVFKIEWAKEITVKRVLYGMTNSMGPLTSLNGASWFMIMLFWVTVSYAIVRTVLKDNLAIDFLLLMLLIAGGMVSIWICMNHYPESAISKTIILLGCRTLFYMQFYHLGYMFKSYFEMPLQECNRVVVCIICILINVALIIRFDDKIVFLSTSEMRFFNSVYLPVITSVTGILFYYEVMDYLAKKLGEINLISFIGRNTLVIMQVHLLFVNVPNFITYYCVTHGIIKHSEFPVDAFRDGAWVRFTSNSRLIGFFCGIFGSLLVAYAIERFKEKIHRQG